MDASAWAAMIAAGVSLASAAVAVWVQWWHAPDVEWLCDGTMRNGAGGLEGLHVIQLQLVNCGDASAYGVETLRCNGGKADPFTVFEAGVVQPGETLDVVMLVHPGSVSYTHLTLPTNREV